MDDEDDFDDTFISGSGKGLDKLHLSQQRSMIDDFANGFIPEEILHEELSKESLDLIISENKA